MDGLSTLERSPATGNKTPGPSRATVVVGVAAFGATLGFFLGMWIGVAFFGIGVLDATAFLAVAATGGAAVGGLLGAMAGAGVATGARGPSQAGAWILRIGVVLALALGALLMVLVGRLSAASHEISKVELPWLRLTTAACAVLAAAVLLHVSFVRPTDPTAPPPGPAARVLAVTGLALAAAILLVILIDASLDLAGAREREMARPVIRSLDYLLDAAGRYEERRGVYPPDASALLAIGARIRPGVELIRAHPWGGGFCMVVGRDTDGDGTLDFVVAGLARPRSASAGRGSTCAGLGR